VPPSASPPGRRRLRLDRPAWPVIGAFLLPGLILFAVVYAYPVVTALSYSLFEWRGIARGPFVGLDNFISLMGLQPYARQFLDATANTGIFFLGTLVVQGVAGMLLALALNRRIRGRRFFQTLYSVPYLMSSLVIGYMWTLILAPRWGTLNAVLEAVGLDLLSRPWLGDPRTILPVVILINGWQWVGCAVLIFGAALAGIPHEHIEAARIDGAGYWQIVRSIQLPQLLPAFQVFTVLIFIGAFNAFDLIYAVGGSSGGPGGAADVLGTLFYRVAFGNNLNALGMSGAMSVVMFVLILAVTLLIQLMFARMRRRYEQ
jgi:raffinose/stachyose/melibiose transport system permease protein